MKHVLSVLILLTVCIASKAQEKYVSIGSGGGITGLTTVYKIFPDGRVLRGKGITEIDFKEIGKLKKSRAKKFLHSASEQTAATPAFNHPGNMYYFISYSENGIEHRVTWGDSMIQVPASTEDLYKTVSAAVIVVKFKTILK